MILVLRRAGRLVGVMPLARRRGALVSTSNWHTPAFSPVVEDEEALAELVRAALERTRVRLDLAFVDEASPAIETCVRVSEAGGFRLSSRALLRSPYLDIEGDWQAYEDQLPSRKKKKYRRFRRRLDEQGEVSIELSDGTSGLSELLRQGFEIEAAGYEDRPGTAIIARPETKRFYTEVAEWAAERGWLRLWMLRLDGAPIAFGYGLEHDRVYFDLKIGFEPRYAALGPGVLLLRERLQYAFTASLRTYEFLGAPERHKLDWTETLRGRMKLQVFAPTIGGIASRIAWERGRPIAKRLLRR
ncbi:MAG: GNAT family N-acetyltransferase [Solirubrobacterales bacterium]